MGERKGQNKWYPPDFDPRKHKSLDAYHGSHPLRERAKKLDKGILVIRFEMPYDIWCGGCGIHIAQSVRYNAEKSKVGMYYTTPIWQFRMRCHLCPQYFEIKTDPASHDYVIISGARRKEKRWDPKENEQIVPDDKSDIKKMKTDAMFKLEHGTDDKAKLKAKIPDLSDIEEAQTKWKDDDLLNQQARQMFRTEKKQIKADRDADAGLLKKSSLDLVLVKEHSDDVRMASLLKYSAVKTFDEKQAEKREEIAARPLFPGNNSQEINSPSPSSISGAGNNSVTTDKDKQLQKVELTKKKLGIKPNKMQTNAFQNSLDFGRKAKQLTSSSLGIMTKTTPKSNERKSKNINSVISQNKPQTSTENETLVCDAESIEVTKQINLPGAVGLGALMASYDSSSESDSCA